MLSIFTRRTNHNEEAESNLSQAMLHLFNFLLWVLNYPMRDRYDR